MPAPQWMTRVFPAIAWNRLHKEALREVDTDRLDAITAQKIASQSIGTSILDQPQRILKLPENMFMCYQHPELLRNPHMLLTGAVLECLEKNKRLPDILYIAENTDIAYQLQLAKSMRVKEAYHNYFHLALGASKKTGIPIKTELPERLRVIYRNGIPRDTVIAVIGH